MYTGTVSLILVLVRCVSLTPRPGVLTLAKETKYTSYEGWHFNRGNYLFTTDTM